MGDLYVEPGDFDGDGLTDLAVDGTDATPHHVSASEGIHVFLAPAGTLSSGEADLLIRDGVPDPVLWLALEGPLDVDRDGRTDILGCCTTAADWFVFTGAELF